MEKRKKRINIQETKDIYTGERSPYWDWARQHQTVEDGEIREDVFANPDVLSEDDNVFHKPLRGADKLKLSAVQHSLADLSPRERQVLQLCGTEGKTLANAARELKITVSTVQYFLNQARAKILKRYKREQLREKTDNGS